MPKSDKPPFPISIALCFLLAQDTSMVSDDSVGAGISLYPRRRCKIIHLLRHAQGIHNLEEAAHSKRSPELLDARLSPLGWEQVHKLRQHVRSTGLLKRIQLVIVSPMFRTMETAVGVFGGDQVKDGETEIPLMVTDAAEPSQGSVSSLDCPPFVAVELCRERIGVNTCDKRRSVNDYKKLFPAMDFSLIESDDDTWWTPDVRESDEDVAARGIKFFNWLSTREEEEIAVVTHSAFLFQTLMKFGNDCHQSETTEMQKFFRNCELRSMMLVDRGMKGASCAKTDLPEHATAGPDKPIDTPNGA